MGILYGDGAASLNVNLGPADEMEKIQAKADLYFRSRTSGEKWTAQPDGRIYMVYQPYSIFYFSGGVEGLRRIGDTVSLFYGGGIRFEDEDIRLLLSFL